MKLKKILAFSVAMTASLSAFGCGSSGNSSSEATTTVKKVAVEDTQEIENIPDDAQKEIIWMGTYDLNPRKGQDKTVEMTLFNNKGGTVKFSQVADNEKFDKLAAALMSQKDVPDIFKYEWMAFPAQVLKDMYQPVDEIVDFDAPLWADVKKNADLFVMGGKHYVAPINFTVGTLMMYDQDVIDSEGLNDPYELYLEGSWNWDTWYEMMSEFCDNAGPDEERYGINGWYQTQLIQQTGKTMVNYDGEKFTSNLDDPDIERAENLLYDIGKNGYVNPDWLGNARKALADGNILFYCMGTWAMTGNNGPKDSDTWRVVPVPSDPNTSDKYMTADMLAYMWVKGSKAKEAVKTWFECSRMANTDQEYKDNGKEKFLNANLNWTEDMYQVFMDCSSSEYQMVFDYGYGISSSMSDDNANEDGSCVTRKLYESVNKTDENGKQYSWSEVRDSYSSTVNAELKTINEAVEKYNSDNK